MDQKRKQEFDDGGTGTKRSKLEASSSIAEIIPEVNQPSKKADRNLFSVLEKFRTSDKPEISYIPQAVPSITQDTSTPPYMDSAIQPSPKDSGVDISSPDRKLDDLGELSSQESSPRVIDPTLHLDVIPKDIISKSTPKYAAIGNFSNVSYVKSENPDLNMNTSDSTCALNQCGTVRPCIQNSPKALEDEEPSRIFDEPATEQGIAGSDGEDQELIIDPVTGLLSLPQICQEHSSSNMCINIEAGGEVQCLSSQKCEVKGLIDDSQDGVCHNNCTLAELNMSQKSTEADLRALAGSRELPESDKEMSEFGAYDSDTLQNDDLFSSLNEGSVYSLSSSGSPTKRVLTNSPRASNSAQEVSPPHTPSTAQCPTKPVPITGFMSEFTKFLQSQSGSKHRPSEKTQRGKTKKCHPKRRDLIKNKGFSFKLKHSLVSRQSDGNRSVGHKSSARHRTVKCLTGKAKRGSAAKSRTDNKSIKSVTTCADLKNVTKMQEEIVGDQSHKVNIESHSERTTSVRKLPFYIKHKATASKSCKFNADRYIKQHNKVCSLREKVLRLLHTLFPDLQYPQSSARTMNTVDVLLDQVLCCVHGVHRSSRRAEVVPSDDINSILDVRIILCKTPLGCLRHLRRKVCHFLETILPGLDLGWPFDRTGDDVEELVQEVIHCNIGELPEQEIIHC